MAGPLTWRNVDAPQFGQTIQGLNTATSMIQNALKDTSGLIGDFKDMRAENADRAIRERMLQFQDPEAYRQALIDNSLFGSEGAYASNKLLSEADARVGTLADQALRAERAAQQKYDFDRTVQGNQLMDNASVDLNRYLTLRNSGDEAGAEKFRASSPTLGNLRGDQIQRMLESGNAFATQDLNNKQGQFTYSTNVRNDQEDRASTDFASALANNSPTNEALQRNIAAMNFPNASVKARTLAKLGAMGYTGLQGPADAAIAQAVGAPDAQGLIATPGMTNLQPIGGKVDRSAVMISGGKELPSNITTLGDFDKNQQSVRDLSPDKNSTALGLYQMQVGTFKEVAQRLYGDGWKNVNVRDPVVQRMMAENYWNTSVKDLTPEQINARWKSISIPQARLLKGRPFEDAEATILAGESSIGQDEMLAIRQRAADTVNSAKQAEGEFAASTGFGTGEYNRLAASQMKAPQAVNTALADKNSPLYGADPTTIDNLVTNVQREAAKRGQNIPPEAAVQIIERSATDRLGSVNNIIQRYLPGAGSDLSAGSFGKTGNINERYSIDETKLSTALDQFLSGSSGKAQDQMQRATTNVGLVTASVNTMNIALAKYERLATIARNNPTPGNQAAAEQAMTELQTARQRVQNVQGSTPTPRASYSGR